MQGGSNRISITLRFHLHCPPPIASHWVVHYMAVEATSNMEMPILPPFHCCLHNYHPLGAPYMGKPAGGKGSDRSGRTERGTNSSLSQAPVWGCHAFRSAIECLGRPMSPCTTSEFLISSVSFYCLSLRLICFVK